MAERTKAPYFGAVRRSPVEVSFPSAPSRVRITMFTAGLELR